MNNSSSERLSIGPGEKIIIASANHDRPKLSIASIKKRCRVMAKLRARKDGQRSHPRLASNFYQLEYLPRPLIALKWRQIFEQSQQDIKPQSFKDQLRKKIWKPLKENTVGLSKQQTLAFLVSFLTVWINKQHRSWKTSYPRMKKVLFRMQSNSLRTPNKAVLETLTKQALQ